MRDSWDDYLINGTNVLINKFNETSKEKLQKLEQSIILILYQILIKLLVL